MSFLDSQLSKPSFPSFSQFVSALNNHKLRISSYEEEKTSDNNLTFDMKRGGIGRDMDMVKEEVHDPQILFLKVMASFLLVRVTKTQNIVFKYRKETISIYGFLYGLKSNFLEYKFTRF